MNAHVEYSAPRLPSKTDITQGSTGRDVGAGMMVLWLVQVGLDFGYWMLDRRAAALE